MTTLYVNTYVELGRWDVRNGMLWNGSNVSFSQNAKIVLAQTTFNDSPQQNNAIGLLHAIYGANVFQRLVNCLSINQKNFIVHKEIQGKLS